MSDFETHAVGTQARLEAMQTRLSRQAARLAKQEEQIIGLKKRGDKLRSAALDLAETVENRDDLTLNKWALKCAFLVTKVKEVVRDDD